MKSSRPAPKVWAIGGGKGGVGKSVVTANMAMSLARRGRRCVIVDADLGGANLHTLVGLSSPRRGLSDLFRREVASLSELLLPTPHENLHLISGAKALLDMANPAHAQKTKLIRQIMTLDVDHVLIDLGAGTSFNMLDFFLAGHERLMVVAPTPTSVENAYHFLKAVFYRHLRCTIQKAGVRHAIDRALDEKVRRGIRSPKELVAQVGDLYPQAAPALNKAMADFVPRLIVNQVRRPQDRDLGHRMATVCSDFFGVKVDCLGHILDDERVLQAVQSRKPVIEMYPESPFSASLHAATTRLLGLQGGSS